nr:Hpt domain-containing protein [Gammaproteobacteria bacterium]
PEKTLGVALDFVDLLWGDRVNENLVKDLNPLNEVEVNFQDIDGMYDTCHLAFDFNRVKIDGKLSHILVTVTDISERVQLARDLEESQAQSQAQLDLLLSILHVEPQVLGTFLDDTDSAMDLINKILRKPARDEASFREKLNEIFREVHKVKGEAATLGLSTIEVKSHDFENALESLRDQSKLDGNDFLPLAVKLDDLLSHLASVRDLIARLSAIQAHESTMAMQASPAMQASAAVAAPAMDSADSPAERTQRLEGILLGSADTQPPKQKPEASALASSLIALGNKVATDTGKQVTVSTQGLEDLPEPYAALVKDVAVQLVRNAVTHGIETPQERGDADKPPGGQVTVAFYTKNDGRHVLRCADDGRGISADNIRITAIQKGLLAPEDAVDLDDVSTMKLLFRPGFSTAEEVGPHAGRGVGMDVIKDLVVKANGKVQMNTKIGEGSTIRVVLPGAEQLVAA